MSKSKKSIEVYQTNKNEERKRERKEERKINKKKRKREISTLVL